MVLVKKNYQLKKRCPQNTSAYGPDSKWYFVNCLWAFVFVSTRKSSAAEVTAKKKLERK